MALNRDRVGATYPAYPYRVTREKIREYASALGETDPRHLGEGCVAPPTFAACFTLAPLAEVVLADGELGAHARMLHASQSFEFGPRPLRDGDLLECTPRIANITERGGNDYLIIEVDCRLRDSADPAGRRQPAASSRPAVQARCVLVFLADGAA